MRREDVKFKVDENKRTIVCWVEGTENMFIDFYTDNFNGCPTYHTFEKCKMPNRFVGKAVCSQDDVWNEELGKLIAYDRMKTALNKSFFNAAKRCVDYQDKCLGDFCDIVNSYGEKLSRNGVRRGAVISRTLAEYAGFAGEEND